MNGKKQKEMKKMKNSVAEQNIVFHLKKWAEAIRVIFRRFHFRKNFPHSALRNSAF